MSGRSLSIIVSMALACVGAVEAAPSGSTSKAPAVYRWVDESGTVHYGDSLPAQASKQESAVLNVHGVEVGRHPAQKTPDELAAADHEEQLHAQQKQHDNFLLTTYTSVKDIEGLRDERLDQLKGQRIAAQQYISSLHERLLGLQSKILLFKPYSAESTARRMPDAMAQDIVHTLNELRSQRSALAAKEQEETSTRAQFQADIDRYRELHTLTAPSTAAR